MNPYLKSCIVEKENKESTFVSPSIKMGLSERSRYSCFKEVKCKWADDLERIARQLGGKNLTQFSLDSEASQNFRETAHPQHHSLGFNSDTISLMHSSGNSRFERNLCRSGSAIFFSLSLSLTVRDRESLRLDSSLSLPSSSLPLQSRSSLSFCFFSLSLGSSLMF